MRINPVFYISLLELVLQNVPIIAPELLDKNEDVIYEVQEILKEAKDDKG